MKQLYETDTIKIRKGPERLSKFKRKLIEKYSRRRYNINSRRNVRNVNFIKRKRSYHNNIQFDSISDSNLSPINVKVESCESSEHFINDFQDITNTDWDVAYDDINLYESNIYANTAINQTATAENNTVKWNLVSTEFHSYLFERTLNDQKVSSSRSKRKKGCHSGSLKQCYEDSGIFDPYVPNFQSDNMLVDSRNKQVAILVHLGVKRPVFPQVYRNITLHCGLKDDQVITDLWAEFSLSSLVSADEPRIKPVVFPVVDNVLLADILDFNNANAYDFHKIEISQEKTAELPLVNESKWFIKSESKEFDIDLKNVPLLESPIKDKKPPMIVVSNVRSLKSENVLEIEKSREDEMFCSEMPCVDPVRIEPNLSEKYWNDIAIAKGFKPCWVVLERITLSSDQEQTDDDRLTVDLEYLCKNDDNFSSLVIPKSDPSHQISLQHQLFENGFDSELNDLSGKHFFGQDHCSRTYGVIVDYVLRNKCTIFLYKMRKTLKFQSKYNKIFQNNYYLRIERDENTMEETFVDVEEKSAMFEKHKLPEEVMTLNPLKIFKFSSNSCMFGTSLLGDSNASSQYTNQIQHANYEILRKDSNVKWVILELNMDVENIKYKSSQVFPAGLLYELIYRANLSKSLLCTAPSSSDSLTMSNFGLYGIPGVCNGVMIGPISVRERSPLLAATIKDNDDSLLEFDIPISSTIFNSACSHGTVVARWWRPGSSNNAISTSMNTLLDFHFNHQKKIVRSNKPTFRVDGLMAAHNARTYIKIKSGCSDSNVTLIHSEFHQSLRSEKSEPVTNENLKDNECSKIPPAARNNYRARPKLDKFEQQVSLQNSSTRKYLLKQRMSPTRKHYAGMRAVMLRNSERERRIEFHEYKVHLCRVLNLDPKKTALSVIIMKAVAEIRQLETKNGGLNALKSQLLQLKNRLKYTLMNNVKRVQNRHTYRKIKNLSGNMLSSFRSEMICSEAICKLVNRNDAKAGSSPVGDGKTSKRRNIRIRRKMETKKYIDLKANPSKGNNLKNVDDSTQRVTSMKSDYQRRYQTRQRVMNAIQSSDKIVEVSDHDYLPHEKYKTAMEETGGARKMHVILSEVDKPICHLVARQKNGDFETHCRFVIRGVIEKVIEQLKKKKREPLVVASDQDFRNLQVLKAMLTPEENLADIIELDEPCSDCEGNLVTTLMSKNRRFTCTLTYNQVVIDEINKRLSYGVVDRPEDIVQESYYIDNVLSCADVDNNDDGENIELIDHIDESKRPFIPRILRKPRRKISIEKTTDDSSKLTEKNSFGKSILFHLLSTPKTSLRASSRSKLERNSSNGMKPPVRRYVTILPRSKKNDVAVQHKDQLAVSRLKKSVVIRRNASETPSDSKQAKFSSASNSLQSKIVLLRKRRKIVHADEISEIRSLKSVDDEHLLFNFSSHIVHSDADDRVITDKDIMMKSENECDSSSVRLQVKPFASINSLQSNLSSNVVKLLK